MSEKIYDRPGVSATYFFPRRTGPLPEDGPAGPVALEAPGGLRIGGWRFAPLDGAPTLLYLYGNGETAADQLGHWPVWAAEAGANLFLVDYAGYGTSAGEACFGGCRAAAHAAFDHLLARPADEVPGVIVMGRSVGSIFAGELAGARAGEPRLRGVAFESGIAWPARRLKGRADWAALGVDEAALYDEVARDFDQQASLARQRVPVLVLHTEHDGLVPVENSRALAEWAGDRLHRFVTFENGDHNSIQAINERAYRAELADFIAACEPR